MRIKGMGAVLNKWKTVDRGKRVKILVFILLLVFYGSLITYKIVLPAAEDLPRQMMNGKDILAGNFDVLYKNTYSYTEPGHQFDNHHWLYGVFAYVLHGIAGFSGIVIFKIILFLFAFSLLFYLSLKRSHFWLVFLFSIPTILMLMGRSAARPEMFSYLFTALYLYLLTRLEDNPQDKKIYWILVLQLLWANMHILFPAGVALVGAFWASTFIKNWKNAFGNVLVRKLTLLLILVTTISFINPLGIGGVTYSLRANTTGAAEVFSAEVQSIASVFKNEPKWDYIGAAILTPMVLLLGASFIIGYKKKNIAYLILCSAFAYLSYKIIRGVPMFALVFLPAITSNLNGSWERGSHFFQKKWPHAKAFFVAAIPYVCIVFLLYATFVWRPHFLPYQISGIGITKTSTEPIEFFKENHLTGPILNDTDIGSYLIYYLYPQEKVFIDNRFADAYSTEFLNNEYKALFTDEEKWKEMLSKYNFNTIILNHYNRGEGAADFIFNRVYDPGWAWVYAGRDALIFVRNTSENQSVIRDHAITPGNISEKLRWLTEAADYQGQVAAADIFSHVGNTKEARAGYERIVARWPHMGKIWYIIGRNELLRADYANSDSSLALLALTNAIKHRYKTPYTYSFLALSYYRLGDIEKTEKMVHKELNLDPESKDGKAWLDILLREKLKQSQYGE